MAVAAVALAAGFGAPLATAGVETFKDVVVRNGADNPVMTMGVGTQKVQVEGTPQISIAGTPQVQAAPAQVVQRHVEFAGNCATIDLPTGRVFVVQAVHVMTPASPAKDFALSPRIKLKTGGGVSFATVPVHLQPGPSGLHIGSTQTLLRVEPADGLQDAEPGQVYGLDVCGGGDTLHMKLAMIVGYFE